jgi:phosphate starvation-inducible protein PhoH
LRNYPRDPAPHLHTPQQPAPDHLCGPADAHLRTIEVGLQVKIAHRHEQFKVDGPKAKAQQAMELLQALYEIADAPSPTTRCS